MFRTLSLLNKNFLASSGNVKSNVIKKEVNKMKKTIDRDPEIGITLIVTLGAFTAASYLAARKLHQLNEKEIQNKINMEKTHKTI